MSPGGDGGLSPFQIKLAWGVTVFGGAATAANTVVDIIQKLFG